MQYKLESFEDLIELCKSEDDCADVQQLKAIKHHLYTLNRLVGMEELKKQVMYQILFFIQGLGNDEMMHTALMGPPGVGKTTVAKVLAGIYRSLGFLSKGKLILANREDLIGQYLGETALKTRSMLEISRGSVLFIDEAYALGSEGGRDSYAKECVDTLTAFLSENTKDFVCIIAGYETDLKRYFFDSNPGLDRRFPWKYTIQPYNPDQLTSIFFKGVRSSWRIKKPKQATKLITEIIKENKDLFVNNGGDVINYINACKMAHSRRVFGSKWTSKKILTEEDFKLGIELVKKNKASSSKVNNAPPVHMYM